LGRRFHKKSLWFFPLLRRISEREHEGNAGKLGGGLNFVIGRRE